MKLLLVHWRDAASFHIGWVSKEDAAKDKCPIGRSVGWELKRDDTELVLVASEIDNEISCDIHIPLSTIVSEEVLR